MRETGSRSVPLIWKADDCAGRNIQGPERVVRQALKVRSGRTAKNRKATALRGLRRCSPTSSSAGQGQGCQFFPGNVVTSRAHWRRKADEFAEAEVTRRSLDFYDQSGGLLCDAYCVQWRLAKRFDDMERRGGGALPDRVRANAGAVWGGRQPVFRVRGIFDSQQEAAARRRACCCGLEKTEPKETRRLLPDRNSS